MLDFQTAIALVERHDSSVEWASSYGEPGYDQKDRGVLLANWNNVPSHVQRGLERRGYALEWSDEWVIDYEGSSKAYRTSPDSYGWTPSFVRAEDFFDGDVVPHSDILESKHLQEAYVEFLLNNPSHAAFRAFDLAAQGFERIERDYETGWHPGQTDDPKEAFKALREEFPGYDFIFSLDGVGQFDVSWSAWKRPQPEEGTEEE